MRKIFLLALSLLFLNLTQRFLSSTVIIIRECNFTPRSDNYDTTYISYCGTTPGINDSLLKHIAGSDSLNVETMFIANPSNVLRDIHFGRYPNLKHLILAGNDASYIDSIRYDFFNNRKLELITFSSVYLNTAANHDPEWKSTQRMKAFVHGQRRDVKVKFEPMGKYNRLGWD